MIQRIYSPFDWCTIGQCLFTFILYQNWSITQLDYWDMDKFSYCFLFLRTTEDDKMWAISNALQVPPSHTDRPSVCRQQGWWWRQHSKYQMPAGHQWWVVSQAGVQGPEALPLHTHLGSGGACTPDHQGSSQDRGSQLQAPAGGPHHNHWGEISSLLRRTIHE